MKKQAEERKQAEEEKKKQEKINEYQAQEEKLYYKNVETTETTFKKPKFINTKKIEKYANKNEIKNQINTENNNEFQNPSKILSREN